MRVAAPLSPGGAGSPMPVRPKNSSISQLLTLLVIVLAVAVLYLGREILIPLALAVLLSFLLTPLVIWLEKCRLGRIPSVVLVLVLAFAVIGALGWMAAHQLAEITDQLPSYEVNLTKKIQSIHGTKYGSLSQVTTAVQDIKKQLTGATSAKSPVPEHARESRSPRRASSARPIPVQVTNPPANVTEYLRTFLGPLLGPLGTAGIVIVFTLFMLVQREDLRNRAIRLAGQGRLNVMTQALDDATQRLSRYLLLQSIVNGSYGCLFGLGLYLIGVPHALLWGVLGGLLRYVPYVGTLIATLFPLAMAAAVFSGWGHVLVTLALYLSLELTIANVVEPWLYGAHTGISSLAVLVAAVFWTMLWGPVGLILSMPLTVCVVVLGRHVPQLKFLEIALSDEAPLPPQASFYQRLLAMDVEEANDIAEAYLKEQPLENLYQAVLVPALNLAEQDRHRNALDEDVESFIYQSTKELIEELGERGQDEPPPTSANGNPHHEVSLMLLPDARQLAAVCVPARDEADEIVGMMVAQLLQRSGLASQSLPIGAVDDMLEQVSKCAAGVVCVSALPPFALGQARSLCKRLRLRFPELKIVVGLWDFDGGLPKAEERLGTGCADVVVTSLAQATMQIRQLSQVSQQREPV